MGAYSFSQPLGVHQRAENSYQSLFHCCCAVALVRLLKQAIAGCWLLVAGSSFAFNQKPATRNPLQKYLFQQRLRNIGYVNLSLQAAT